MIAPKTVSINFAQGLDLKSDPWQVPVGKFLSLENTVFNKGGQLQKRNGFGSLPSLPNSNSTYLTTFNGNLTAISNSISALSASTSQWVTKGNIQPLSLNTLSLIRSNTNQSQADIAIAPNGLICTVYTDQNPANLSQSIYKYVVADSVTGQNIVEPTLIPAGSGAITGAPRVFLLNNNFIIMFTNEITSVFHLQYIAVNTNNPTNVSTPADLAAAYVPSATLSFDAVVVNNNLYYAYNQTTGGQSVNVNFLSSSLTVQSPTAITGYTATMMNLCVDTTNLVSPTIYISFYNSATFFGYVAAVNTQLQILMNPALFSNSVTINNIASAAQNGSCNVYYEVANDYVYDFELSTNYINLVTVTLPTTTFGGTFNSGSTSVTASPSTGLVSGEFVQDLTTPANIPLDTTFTISGSTLTLSNATVGSSPYVFTCSTTITVTAGATYTNNAHTFTVLTSVASSHTLTCSGTGAPTSTGTLTKASGTGTTPITFTSEVHNADTLVAIKVSAATTVVRGLGLASKAFIINDAEYFLSTYDDSVTGENGIQQTYFLINGSASTESAPIVIGKLAWQNGGGYLKTGLPNVIVNGNFISVPYLFKDLIQSVNKGSYASSSDTNSGFAWTPPFGQVSGIYSQTGINYATFELGAQQFDTAEIGSALHMSGGFFWMYDGYLPVEHNFFIS